MATINFVESVVNSLFDQSTGKIAITSTNLQGVIGLGNKVLNSAEDKDVFVNTLVDRIGKVIISTRPYKAQLKNIVKDTMEYGTLVQKIYVKPIVVEKNESWDLEDGADISTVLLKKPVVVQKLFENRNTFEVEISIPDYQLKTAFTGESTMAAFISSIYTAIETGIEAALENLANMCVANFMAEKIHYASENAGEGVHAINLLDVYNKATNAGLTVENCLKNAEFLKFAGRTIKLHMNRMSRLGQIYNIDKLDRHTPKEDLNLLLLTDYASASATYLEADTFHNELVALPGYTEVSYWQGQGTTGAFADVSKISVTTASGDVVEQGGILAFMFDRDALGVMIQKTGAYSQYYPKRNVTQHWEKLDRGYFNDLSENGLVFYIAEA